MQSQGEILTSLHANLAEFLHARRQRERLLKEKRQVDKDMKRCQETIISDLQALGRDTLHVDGTDGLTYEIKLKTTTKRTGMRGNERENFIDNIVQKRMDPNELAESIKDALQGDVEYVDKLAVKKLKNVD